jgi:hypothetical protein
VIFYQQGNLYGTAGSGGSTTEPDQAKAQGLIFELTPAGDGTWTKNTIYTFVSSGVAPSFPRGRLTFDGSGNLYGVTFGGAGTVFKLTNTSSGWKHRTLYTFCSLANCADGISPQGGLTLRGGNLNGVTYTGGMGGGSCDGGCGVVYELSHTGGSWHQSALYSFTGGWMEANSTASPRSTLPAMFMVLHFGEAMRIGELFGKLVRAVVAGRKRCFIVFMATAMTVHFPVPA